MTSHDGVDGPAWLVALAGEAGSGGGSGMFDGRLTQLGEPLDLRSAAAVVAIIPQLLGFVPEDSVVRVEFDRGGCLRRTMRVDQHLFAGGSAPRVGPPEPPRDPEAVSALVAAFARDERAGGAAAACAARKCQQEGLEVLDAGAVVGSRWIPVDADGSPVPGEASLTEGEPLEAKCHLVLAGVSFLPDRASLEATVRGADPVVCDQVAEALRSQSAGTSGAGAKRLGARSESALRRRRRVEDAVVGFLRGLDPSPNPRDLAAWATALKDSRVREPVLWRLSPASSEGSVRGAPGGVTDRLAGLVRCVPPPACAPLASMLAAVAWQSGHGTLAGIAAGYACESDPANRLGSLVSQAVRRGAPPALWIDLMRSFTVGELRHRGGRSRAPS